jgi:uncharacterized protein YndB with AHSA1/START domain
MTSFSASTFDDAVMREVRIEASPEVVFGFFTDPAKMMQWKGTEAMLDARPGGVYRVNVTGREVARGEYLEVTPYSRIVFSWGWEEGPITPGSTLVEVRLIPDGSGTILQLRHAGLSGEGLEAHLTGWEHYLPRLVVAAQGGDPGVDPWTLGPAAPDAT